MTVSGEQQPGLAAEDVTIEKDGGILKEVKVRLSLDSLQSPRKMLVNRK